MTHGLGVARATAPGPMLTLPNPISEVVAVGSEIDGPTPDQPVRYRRWGCEGLVDIAEAEHRTRAGRHAQPVL